MTLLRHDLEPEPNACWDCGELLDPFTYDGGPLVTRAGALCPDCQEKAA